MKTPKQEIAEYTSKLLAISESFEKQFLTAMVSHKELFYLGIIRRTSIILKDIEIILKDRHEFQITSSLILFRCLLDDFITLLYLKAKDFDEEEMIKITAKAYSNKYKMLKNSSQINKKHFNDTNTDLATSAMYEDEMTEFCNDPENHRLFEDVSRRKWKKPATTTEMITGIATNEITTANAHALILWQLHSNYVHYSSLTEVLERNKPSRIIEISQLKEVLVYVYRGLLLCSDILNTYGLENRIQDGGFLEEIFASYENE